MPQDPADRDAIRDLARTLDGAAFPWWVAGGWALDVFLGAPIRHRKDLDVAVLRRDQAALRTHLRGWDLHVAVAGTLEPWAPDRRLEPPLHEIWARPAQSETWRYEFLLNESSDSQWVFRRDRRIVRDLDVLLASRRADVPFLPPELVLLFKSNDPRPTDEVDFRAVLSRLSRQARTWLGEAIALTHRGHPWVRALDAAAPD
jgi:hypothetical protein